ncbi:hypothetical protein E2C01_037416 [Portunus trituberculatus]|uniref:Uncharacterized protein n=1 Tax=Portunus trituberculatus TaxID=210409 RepID=A0A5B7FH15_PORTR|nr:hypothetical protein [Portunus trituberculatus]
MQVLLKFPSGTASRPQWCLWSANLPFHHSSRPSTASQPFTPVPTPCPGGDAAPPDTTRPDSSKLSPPPALHTLRRATPTPAPTTPPPTYPMFMFSMVIYASALRYFLKRFTLRGPTATSTHKDADST